MSDFVPTPRKKHYSDDYKMRLSGELQPGGRFPPSLHLTVVNNNPRIDVYTNKPDDKNKGQIQAKMDARSCWALLSCLESLLTEPPKSQYIMKNSRPGMNREIITESNTVIGKDDEGRIYISVISSDSSRPKIRFIFGNTMFHTLSAGNGRKLTDAEISVMFAKGWLDLIRSILPNIMTDNFVEPEKKDYSGGGYQKKPYQSGGGNPDSRSSTPAAATTAPAGNDFDDDMPF